jgi:two-component system, NtrC family, response regulator HydG
MVLASILIIDDEESTRFTFDSFLSEKGHQVFTSGDYDEALGIISDVNLDLIFSDILLQGNTGIDILREVKKRNPHCPVVMITGYPNIETASEALRLGAFDYISKPIRREALLHVAGLALQHKALVDENEEYRHNLEAIFRSVKDAIITVDRDLRILAINEAAESICGLSADSIGEKFGCLDPACNGRCLQALEETIEKKHFVEIFGLECQHPSRGPQVVNVSVSPLIDRNGQFSGSVMVVRDETRLASLEQDLKERRGFHNLIGKSEEMQKVYELVKALADVETTVLITGESGTGKELVAEAIHYSGARSRKPYVKVSCAALSESLLESELFGHVRGAFTGAIRDKSGRFQAAHEGTIFLDEIGDISPKMQSNLLRVLQEKEFERVGDSTPVKVDVRVITATNQNLREKVARGEFREDLYYRLKVLEMHLAPLRDRIEDIPLLVDHFLRRFNKEFNKKIQAISDDVRRLFLNYSWPGNVRELEHTLEHAFVLCRQDTITLSHLPPELHDVQGHADHVAPATSGKRGRCDHETLLQALKKTAGNKARAARLLSVSERTIFRKLKQYDIKEHEIQEP